MSRQYERTIRPLRIGKAAGRLLSSQQVGGIAAVFDRSLYIKAGEMFCCIGASGIGDGPLNLIVSDDDLQLILSGSVIGEPVALGRESAAFGLFRIAAQDCPIWAAAPWPAVCARSELERGLSLVEDLIRAHAPGEGLSRLVVARGVRQERGKGAVALAKNARPRLALLEAWLARAIAGDLEAAGQAPSNLLGLGPGLTPSGDDLICGGLIALDALGDPSAQAVRDRLAAAVLGNVASSTTPLSAAFLVAAAEGHGSGALHSFVAAVAGGRLFEIEEALSTLGEVGHSSGWDAAAGVVVVLRAALSGEWESGRARVPILRG